jgi:hypothetical protein
MSKTQSTLPTTALADSALRPTTPSPEPAQISLQFETEVKYPVEYKNQKRMLSGVADYTLWYDSYESAGTNVVVVEAKRRGWTIKAVGQLIAYMGGLYSITPTFRC